MVANLIPAGADSTKNWLNQSIEAHKSRSYFEEYGCAVAASIDSTLNIARFAVLTIAKPVIETAQGRVKKGAESFSINLSNTVKSTAFVVAMLFVMTLRTLSLGHLYLLDSQSKPSLSIKRVPFNKEKYLFLVHNRQLFLMGANALTKNEQSEDAYILINNNIELTNQWFEQHDGRFNYLYDRVIHHLSEGKKLLLVFVIPSEKVQGSIQDSAQKYFKLALAQNRMRSLENEFKEHLHVIGLSEIEYSDFKRDGKFPDSIQTIIDQE